MISTMCIPSLGLIATAFCFFRVLFVYIVVSMILAIVACQNLIDGISPTFLLSFES